MTSQKYFVRDPREVPFLHNQMKRLLALAVDLLDEIEFEECDDFGFMTTLFLLKQVQHAESLLILVPRRDCCLVARTMIEGSYQLLWASQKPQERGKLWRSFSVIDDWRLIQGRLREGLPVEPSDIQRNDEGLKKFGALHRMKKQKASSQDPYNRTWRGGVTISDMAESVGRELYDITYTELSDWEHWGVSGIGDLISRRENQIASDPTSERVTGLALLASFQSLFQTLEVAAVHFSLNCAKPLDGISMEFRHTLDSFYVKKSVAPQP